MLIDPAVSGAANMAFDEALLEAAAAGSAPTLRIYRWDEPTLSLGYFQSHHARREHPPSAGCPLVRRLSGGGAIVHDRELTYSLTLPRQQPWSARTESLYEAVHLALIAALKQMNVAARLCGDDACAKPGAPQPLLCFQRRAPGDVLVEGAKVAGSAQRRRAGAVLQHGSVLLAASSAAPELPGVGQFSAAPISGETLVEAWLDRLAAQLGLQPVRASYEAALRRRAEELERTKYATAQWNCRR